MGREPAGGDAFSKEQPMKGWRLLIVAASAAAALAVGLGAQAGADRDGPRQALFAENVAG